MVQKWKALCQRLSPVSFESLVPVAAMSRSGTRYLLVRVSWTLTSTRLIPVLSAISQGGQETQDCNPEQYGF